MQRDVPVRPPNRVDSFRQMGVYAGRILKGTGPADLPVPQSDKFEIVTNRTALRNNIVAPKHNTAHSNPRIKIGYQTAVTSGD
jgi:ABC-type uncharacterized transport system substrate-binding protein